MKTIKNWNFASFLIANALILFTVGNVNAMVKKSISNELGLCGENQAITQPAILEDGTSIQAELDRAKESGKAVFVVVTGNGIVEQTERAESIAKGASGIINNASIIKMNRDDAENVDLVKKWGLSQAPIPLILVVSTSGRLIGGLILSQANAQNIAAMVPTPKHEDIYSAVDQGKSTFLVVTKKSFSDRAKVLNACQKAVSILNDKAIVVEVELDDQNEVNLFNKLNINRTVKSSMTYVINNKGQISGTAVTEPDAKKLALAATTPVKSGCGPDCGPAGCEK